MREVRGKLVLHDLTLSGEKSLQALIEHEP
jgi:hypothetical protein